MKNTSIATNYRPVKAFCKWLYQEDYLDKDITIGVRLPKKDPAIVEPLTALEVKQIDDTIINKSVNKHIALRNYCIFHLALDCGLRRKEIVQLRRMDIKSDRLIIHNAKNNKDRIVLLPRFLYMSLNNYFIESHEHYHFENNSKFVFLDFYDIEPITLNTIKCFYQDLKTLSGIDLMVIYVDIRLLQAFYNMVVTWRSSVCLWDMLIMRFLRIIFTCLLYILMYIRLMIYFLISGHLDSFSFLQ